VSHSDDAHFVFTPHHLMDSKTALLDDALLEKLERAFHKETSQLCLHDIAIIAIEHDPIDLAYAAHRLPVRARLVVFENLPDLMAKATFIVHTNRDTRLAVFRHLSDDAIREMVDVMPIDDALDVLDDLSDRRSRRIVEKIDPKRRFRIKELQKHTKRSAGRLMTDEFFAFSMDTSIGEASAHIRDHPGIDLNRTIFVISDDGELIGAVPARNLIVNPDFLPLRQVMRPVIHFVRADASRDEVIDIVERYGIPTLPVVDEKNVLIGVILHEDVVEVMEDVADQTIASIAGTGEDVSEHEPIFRRFLWRAPWLIVTLFAGMVTSTTLAHFQERIWFAFLPFFVPLIAGMSGNVGLQCSTILVRGMATGELSKGSRKEAITREISIGLLIGLVFGLLCGVFVFMLNAFGVQQFGSDPISIGVTISIGLLGACLTATLMGTFSPFFFGRVGIDPAVASGPIVTAVNDVTSTLSFLFISRIVYAAFL